MFRQAPSFPYHDLGIVEDGNTASRAISKDAYVIWKGLSYFASTDILQGATLEEDVNLTAIPDGVINGVMEAANNKLDVTSEFILNSGVTVISGYANQIYKFGNIIFGSLLVSTSAGVRQLITVPSKYKPMAPSSGGLNVIGMGCKGTAAANIIYDESGPYAGHIYTDNNNAGNLTANFMYFIA